MVNCLQCNDKVESVLFQGRLIKAIVCDACAEREQKSLEKEKHELDIRAALSQSHIPYYHLEKLPVKPVEYQIAAQKFMDGLDKTGDKEEAFPYLWGPNGTGKTLLSIGLLKRLVIKHNGSISVRYLKISELARTSKYKLTEEIKSIGTGHYALLLDDLGNHNMFESTLEALIDLIEIRLASGKRTIVTSNYKPTKLVDRMVRDSSRNSANINMCNAIMDRVLELCTPINIDGPSIRMKSAIERLGKIKNG